jgi:hypothetical protein
MRTFSKGFSMVAFLALGTAVFAQDSNAPATSAARAARSADGVIPNALGDANADLTFFPVTPCRLLDTRIGTGTFAGPKAPNTEVAFSVNDSLTPQGGNPAGCGIPGNPDPPALSVIITAVPTDTNQGNLRAFPTFGAVPTAAMVNYQDGVVTGSGTIARSGSSGFELTVRNQGAATTHIVVDVNGYFAAAGSGAPIGRAYASVQRSPVVQLEGARTKGFSAVTRPSTGVYCLTFIPPTPSATGPIMVTVEWSNSLGFDLLAFPLATVFTCPAGQLEVRTYQFPAGAAALSNNVSFYVLVP